MTDLDEVTIERTADSRDRARAVRGPLPIIIAAVVVIGLFGAAYFTLRRPPASNEAGAGAKPSAPSAAVTRPTAEPGESIPLPPLDQTDALVRELVARLSSHPRVAAWLTTDQLVRNFTVVVLAIAEGRSPGARLRPLAPEGPFQVVRAGTTVRIDPRTFERYDGHASAVEGIDARGAARLYATLKPRIEEAYKELGAPHGDFDRTLERAIAHLLQTPATQGPLVVEKAPVSFRFADPAIEGLSPAQKQLLRMGPDNVRIVQEKLREIARYLGMP